MDRGVQLGADREAGLNPEDGVGAEVETGFGRFVDAPANELGFAVIGVTAPKVANPVTLNAGASAAQAFASTANSEKGLLAVW